MAFYIKRLRQWDHLNNKLNNTQHRGIQYCSVMMFTMVDVQP